MSTRGFVTPHLHKYLYKGRLIFEPDIRKLLRDKIDVYSKKEDSWPGIEFLEVMTGRVEGDLIIVERMYDVTRWSNVDSLTLDMNLLRRICRKKFVIGTYHVHPQSAPLPSWTDIETFGTVDLNAGHPVIHAIENTDGQMLVWDFKNTRSDIFHDIRNDLSKI